MDEGVGVGRRWLALAGLWAAHAAVALAQPAWTTTAHLAELDQLRSPTGSEGRLAAYIADKTKGLIDSTGSVSLSFGSGSPHTLIVAGLDEPAMAVSSIRDDGYLRVHSLADPEPGFRFAAQWQGQPVRVGLNPGLAGVFVAPSVHLRESRFGSTATDADDLYLDIGARSREEALAAGAEILDPVIIAHSSLPAKATPADPMRWGAPWFSSKTGWLALLELTARYREAAPQSRVTVAFATGQWRYHTGLARLLEMHRPDRALVLLPGGEAGLEIGSARGYSSPLVEELKTAAEAAGVAVRPGSSPGGISFGPFAREESWPLPEASATLRIGSANPNRAYEVASVRDIARAAALLAEWTGSNAEPAAPPRTDSSSDQMSSHPQPKRLDTLAVLTSLLDPDGLSGEEEQVRQKVEEYVPAVFRERMEVDEAGNLILRLGRAAENPAALFVAHMDEIGFRTTETGQDGVTRVESVGGLIPELFEFHPHSETVFLDAQRVAAAFHKGTPILVRKSLTGLLNGRWAARGFDDRVGCAVLLRALMALEGETGAANGEPVWVVFSVGEETGLNGARALAKRVTPRRVYPIDSFVSSDSPLENGRFAAAELGKGFVLRAADQSGMTPRGELERVRRIAGREKIAMQIGFGNGGNDGSVFVPKGSINVPLAWPLRNAHTAVETLDEKDVAALEAITLALIRAELRASR